MNNNEKQDNCIIQVHPILAMSYFLAAIDLLMMNTTESIKFLQVFDLSHIVFLNLSMCFSEWIHYLNRKTISNSYKSIECVFLDSPYEVALWRFSIVSRRCAHETILISIFEQVETIQNNKVVPEWFCNVFV